MDDASVASLFSNRNGEISATQKETSVIYDAGSHDDTLAVGNI